MLAINRFLFKLRKCIKGQTATEYALIIGGISLGLYMMVRNNLVDNAKESIETLSDRVKSGINQDVSGGGTP